MNNSQVNGILARLAKLLGKDAASVAAFYLTHQRSLYVAGKHPVELLLRDAEGLATQWKIGRATTDTESRQADSTAATGNVFGELLDEAKRAR